MAASAPPSRSRFAGLVAAALEVVIVAAMLALAPTAAHAQWGFFGGFLGGQPPQQPQRYYAPPRPEAPRSYYYAPRRRHHIAPIAPMAPRETRDVEKPKPPPIDAAHLVLVIGDSMAQFLANGVEDALSDRTDVGVLRKARDSTGLVRQDYYDWPKAVDAILDDKPAGKGKIDVALMMIGSNDRQSITESGKTYAPDTDEWTSIYTRRVTEIAEAFKKKNVPLIWVGVPITKNDSFADAMAGLNDIYRDVAAKTGAVFVDTWEGFSDDDGDYDAFGPDINGQTVRLRSSDGIHFTKAGARKLAHFIEADVRRALDRVAPPPPPSVATAPGATASAPAEKAGPTVAVAPATPVAPAKPDAGPIKILTEPPVAENGRLDLPAAPGAADGADTLLDATLVKGEPRTPSPGRADDATWPRR